MQIRGLHRSIYRGARLASRLETKERSDEVHRRDAVARWQQARRDGLGAEKAAAAVGHPPSTLYRWANSPTLKSRRPKTTRKTTGPHARPGVEEWRLEEPPGARPRSSSSCASKASLRPRPPSGASSPTSSSAARSCPCQPCARPPRRESGPPNAAGPSACPRPQSPTGPARSSSSIPSTLPSLPADTSSTSPLTTQSPSGPSPRPTPRHSRLAAMFPQAQRHSLKVYAIRSWGSEFSIRGRLPAARHQALSAAAKEPRAQRRGGTMQQLMALRVLRRLRPANPPRGPQSIHRCLPASLQHLPTPRRPWRKNTRTVPCSPPSQRDIRLSYVLARQSLSSLLCDKSARNTSLDRETAP